MSRAAMVRPVLTLLSRDKDARAQVSDAVMGDEQVATRGATTAGLDAARQLARQIAQRRRETLAAQTKTGDGATDGADDDATDQTGADVPQAQGETNTTETGSEDAPANPAVLFARAIQARRREQAQVGPIKGLGLGIEQGGPQTVANAARKAQTAIAGVQQAPEIAAGLVSRNTATGRAVRTDLRTPMAQPTGAIEDTQQVRANVSDAAMQGQRENPRMSKAEAKAAQDNAEARDAQNGTKNDTLTRVRDWLGTVAQEFGATAQEMDTRNQSRMTREGVGGAVTRFAYDAGKSAAPMAASVAATVTGGAVAGPGGALAAGFATSFVTEGGDTAQTVYDDLRAQNMSEEEALASAFYAAAPAGAAKAAIEQFGAERVFRGLLKPFAQRVGITSENVMRRAATQWATAALAEAGEEVSQGTVDRTVRTVTTGQGAEPVSWQALREMGREALLGGVMGGAMAGPGVVAGAVQAKRDAKAVDTKRQRDAAATNDAAGESTTGAGAANESDKTKTTPADARTASSPTNLGGTSAAAATPDDAGSIAREQEVRAPEKAAEGAGSAGGGGEQRTEKRDAEDASVQDGAEVDARIDEIVDELDRGEADDAQRRELLNELARLRGEEVNAQAGQQDGAQSTGTGDASDAAQDERGAETAQVREAADQQLLDQRGQPAQPGRDAGVDSDQRTLADERRAGNTGADWVGDGVVRGDAPRAGVGAARGRVSGSDEASSNVEAGAGGARANAAEQVAAMSIAALRARAKTLGVSHRGAPGAVRGRVLAALEKAQVREEAVGRNPPARDSEAGATSAADQAATGQVERPRTTSATGSQEAELSGAGSASADSTRKPNAADLRDVAARDVAARDVAAIARATGKPARVVEPATDAQRRIAQGVAALGGGVGAWGGRRVVFVEDADGIDGAASVGEQGDGRTVYLSAKLATDEDAAPILAHETLHLAVAQDAALRAELAGMIPVEELTAAAAKYREKLVRSFTNDHPAVKRFDSDAQVREEEAVASLLQEAAAATPQGMKLARQLYETPGLLERIRQQIVKTLDKVGIRRMAPQTKAMMRLLDQVAKNAKEGRRRARAEARVEASRARAEGRKEGGSRGRKGQESASETRAAETPMMFAPSDRPSNPADAEAAQRAWVALGTRSPWFKEWFGDWEVAAARATRERAGQLARAVPLVVSDAPLQSAKVEQDAASEAAKSIASETKIRNTDTGWSIAVPRRSLRKPLSHAADPAQARSVTLVPQMLQHAVLIGTHQNHRVAERRNVPRVHNLVAPVRIAGTLFRAHMTIKEMTDGQRYYDHDLTRLEQAGIETAGTEKVGTKENGPPSARLAANPRLADSGPVSISIGELLGDVKPVSKAVDGNGAPRVVYHGSPTPNFTTFDTSRIGSTTTKPGDTSRALHFAENPENATGYSRMHENIVAGNNGLKAETMQRLGIPEKVKHASGVLPVYLNLSNPLDVGASKNITAAVIADAKARGHDGLVANLGTGREYVVFDPSQVKSATGNVGTFDADNPDIRFAPSGKRAEGREEGKDGAAGDSQDKTRAEARARASEERARTAEERADRAELAKGVQAAMVKQRVKKFAQEAKEADREIAALEKKVDREKVKAQSEKATARETLTTLRTLLRAATKRNGSLTKAAQVLDAVAARMEAQSQIRDVELANAASDNRARFKENNKLRAENRRLKEEAKANLASERRVADARETATRAEAKAKAAAMTQAQRDRERIREELVRLVTKLVPAERQGQFIRDVRDVKNTGELYEITGRIMEETTNGHARELASKVRRLTGLADMQRIGETAYVDRAMKKGRLSVVSGLTSDAKGELADAQPDSPKQKMRDAIARFAAAGARFDAAKGATARANELLAMEAAHLDMATIFHAARLEKQATQKRRRRGALSVARAIIDTLASAKDATFVRAVGKKGASLIKRGFMALGDIQTFATMVDGKAEGGAFDANIVQPILRAERAYMTLRTAMAEKADAIARRAGFDSLAEAQVKLGGALGEAAATQYTLAKPIDLPGMKGIKSIPAPIALDLYATDPATLTGVLAGRPLHVGELLEDGEGFQLTPDTYRTIIDAIPLEHRVMVDEMKADANSYFALMKRVVYALTGRDLEGVDQQHPRTVNPKWKHRVFDAAKAGSEAIDPSSLTDHVTGALENMGIAKNRTSETAPLVISSFFAKHESKLDEMARIIHLAEPIRDAKMALQVGELGAAMATKVHPQAMARVTLWLNDVAGAAPAGKGPGKVTRFIVKAGRNVAQALTALNIKSWLRNLGGLFMLKAAMPARVWARGMAGMFAHDWETIVASSPYIKHTYGGGYYNLVGGAQTGVGEGGGSVNTAGTTWQTFRRAAAAMMKTLGSGLGEAWRAGKAGFKGDGDGVRIGLANLARDTMDLLVLQPGAAFDGVRIMQWWAGLSARVAYAGWQAEAKARGFDADAGARWAVEQTEKTLRATQGQNNPMTRSEVQTRAIGTPWQPFWMFTSDAFRGFNLLAQAVMTGQAEYKEARRGGAGVLRAVASTKQGRSKFYNVLAGLAVNGLLGGAISAFVKPWEWLLGYDEEEKDRENAWHRFWTVSLRDSLGSIAPGVVDRLIEAAGAMLAPRRTGQTTGEALLGNPALSMVNDVFGGADQLANGFGEWMEGDDRQGNTAGENMTAGLLRFAAGVGTLVRVPGMQEVRGIKRAWDKSSEQGTNRVENWLQTAGGD